MKKELTYFDGIIEGRLIENGFSPIGNDMFVKSNEESHSIIKTDRKNGDYKNSEFIVYGKGYKGYIPEDGIEAKKLVGILEENECHLLKVNGDIYSIIFIIQSYKN